jgi:hypothetical protein
MPQPKMELRLRSEDNGATTFSAALSINIGQVITRQMRARANLTSDAGLFPAALENSRVRGPGRSRGPRVCVTYFYFIFPFLIVIFALLVFRRMRIVAGT